jgi:hypothetical protein
VPSAPRHGDVALIFFEAPPTPFAVHAVEALWKHCGPQPPTVENLCEGAAPARVSAPRLHAIDLAAAAITAFRALRTS